jgi:predicted secreted protein
MAALARLGASLVLVLTLLAVPALAGDRALLDTIGYSADGQYFAFEEFGIGDGSGFAYSSIYVIDLKADKWTYGTPFEGRANESHPERPLAEVRAAARANANDKLKAHKIGGPVQTLALVGDGASEAEGRTLSFATPLCCGPGRIADDLTALRLETFAIRSDEAYCTDMKPVGYALTRTQGGAETLVHRDGKRLPFTRGCTLDYGLYAVVAPFEGKGPRVAIIATYPFGFEGPDRRFIAVALEQP